jgi:hypothetical protein
MTKDDGPSAGGLPLSPGGFTDCAPEVRARVVWGGRCRKVGVALRRGRSGAAAAQPEGQPPQAPGNKRHETCRRRSHRGEGNGPRGNGGSRAVGTSGSTHLLCLPPAVTVLKEVHRGYCIVFPATVTGRKSPCVVVRRMQHHTRPLLLISPSMQRSRFHEDRRVSVIQGTCDDIIADVRNPVERSIEASLIN